MWQAWRSAHGSDFDTPAKSRRSEAGFRTRGVVDIPADHRIIKRQLVYFTAILYAVTVGI
jgi:hypothetical protein